MAQHVVIPNLEFFQGIVAAEGRVVVAEVILRFEVVGAEVATAEGAVDEIAEPASGDAVAESRRSLGRALVADGSVAAGEVRAEEAPVRRVLLLAERLGLALRPRAEDDDLSAAYRSELNLEVGRRGGPCGHSDRLGLRFVADVRDGKGVRPRREPSQYISAVLVRRRPPRGALDDDVGTGHGLAATGLNNPTNDGPDVLGLGLGRCHEKEQEGTDR